MGVSRAFLLFCVLRTTLLLHTEEVFDESHKLEVDLALSTDNECLVRNTCSSYMLQMRRQRSDTARMLVKGQEPYPPMCDPDIVASSCWLLNYQTRTYYGDRIDTNSAYIYAAEIAEHVMVERDSVIRFLSQTLEMRNADADLAEVSALRAFAVSCAELCNKTVGYFDPKNLPNASDVGCYVPFGTSRAVCDIDVPPRQLNSVYASSAKDNISGIYEEDGGSEEAQDISGSSLNKMMDAAAVDLGHARIEDDRAKLKELEAVNYPYKSDHRIAVAIANLFRVYPLTNVSHNGNWANMRRAYTNTSTNKTLAEQMNSIARTGVKAQAMVSTALRRMHTDDAKKNLLKWYGQDNQVVRREVRRILNGVHHTLSNVDFAFPSKYCMVGVLAYVNPQPPLNKNSRGQDIIHVCPEYFQADECAKLETFIHESSHFTPTVTKDICMEGSGPFCTRAYGRTPCLELAKDNSSLALRNADSFAFFVSDQQEERLVHSCPNAPECSVDATCGCLHGLTRMVSPMGAGKQCYYCDNTAS